MEGDAEVARKPRNNSNNVASLRAYTLVVNRESTPRFQVNYGF